MENPQNPVAPRFVTLMGVDLTGDASRVTNSPFPEDGMTVGQVSKAKAVFNAIGAGNTTTRTLVEAVESWRERGAAAEQLEKARAAAITPEEVEAKATRKGAKRFAKHVREGVSPAVAVVKGHAHYKKHGGKSSLPVWAKKISQG